MNTWKVPRHALTITAVALRLEHGKQCSSALKTDLFVRTLMPVRSYTKVRRARQCLWLS